MDVVPRNCDQKMNRRKAAGFIGIALLVFLLWQVLPWSRAGIYRRSMEDLRQEVKIGEDIFDAKSKIEDRYHSVSEPYDPSKDGEVLWMDVSFGLRPNALETFLYSADLPISLPSFGSGRISALVVADHDGSVMEIR